MPPVINRFAFGPEANIAAENREYLINTQRVGIRQQEIANARSTLKGTFYRRQAPPTVIGSSWSGPNPDRARQQRIDSRAYARQQTSIRVAGEEAASREAIAAHRGRMGTFTVYGERESPVSVARREANVAAARRADSAAWAMKGVSPLEAREVERLNWTNRVNAVEAFGKFSPVVESENFQRARDLDRRIARDKAFPGRLAAAKANSAANAEAAEVVKMDKAFGKVTSNSGEGMLNRMAGRLYKMTSSGADAREAKMLARNIDFNGTKMTMGEAIARSADNPAALGELGQQYGRMFGKGAGMFDMGAAGRLMLNADNAARKTALGGAALGYMGLNKVSKVALGASLASVGFAGAVVGGLGLTAASMAGISGSQIADTASTVHQTMKSMSKPVYGSSELGQSTQGLVFGLNSRRRG